jgi:hypothetical protein
VVTCVVMGGGVTLMPAVMSVVPGIRRLRCACCRNRHRQKYRHGRQ